MHIQKSIPMTSSIDSWLQSSSFFCRMSWKRTMFLYDPEARSSWSGSRTCHLLMSTLRNEMTSSQIEVRVTNIRTTQEQLNTTSANVLLEKSIEDFGGRRNSGPFLILELYLMQTFS